MASEKTIRNSLTKQLGEKGILKTGNAYIYDLVEDYLALWRTKEMLIADIDENGVTIAWQNSPTQKGFKKNDSVAELQRTNAQMLKLLDFLGLDVTEVSEDVAKDVTPKSKLL